MLCFRAPVAGLALAAAVVVGGCSSDSTESAGTSNGAPGSAGFAGAAGAVGASAGSSGSGDAGGASGSGGAGGSGGGSGGASGAGTAGMAGATGAPTFAEIRAKIFQPSCGTGNCHLNGKSEGSLDLSDPVAFGQLVNVASTANPTKVRVVPGSSATSFLFAKVNGDVAGDGSEGAAMPLIVGMLPDDKIALIKAWIDAGAKNDLGGGHHPPRS